MVVVECKVVGDLCWCCSDALAGCMFNLGMVRSIVESSGTVTC